MGRAAILFLALSCAYGLPGSFAWGYTPTVSGGGVQVHWPSGFRYNLAGNPGNATGLPAELLRASVVRGLQRWNEASKGAVRFDYWQGDNPAIYEPNSDYNGLSSIYFATNQRGSGAIPVSPNVLGLTQVWYNTNTGAILEADIILNDRDYEFTDNPRDTSGPGSSSSDLPLRRSRVYLDNVVTHELGHAFGLSHSGAMQASMLYMESPEQARLGCDDIAGVSALYPSAAGRASERGQIEGQVRSAQGPPILGAQVTAISARRGTLMATALTDRSGRYTIQGLEPGSYFLMVEPFFAGSSALPAYYSGLESSCPPDQIFSRVFLTRDGGNSLYEVGLAPGARAGAPELVVNCTASRAGAEVAESLLSDSPSSAPVAFSSGTDGQYFGFVDRMDNGVRYYALDGVSGRIEIKALSFSLYSPVRTKMTLLTSSGSPVNARASDRSYEGKSGFTDFDSSLVAENLPPGNYVLSVSAANVSPSSYPGGQFPIDTVPFVVITGAQNAPSPAMPEVFPANSRCALSEQFPPYASPPGEPPRANLLDDDPVGFCGTVRDAGNRSDSDREGGTGAPITSIIGWFLPYALALACVRGLRSAPRPVILSVR